MRPAPQILFYVQHLLGVGHIKRAALLVQGWLAQGFQVSLVMGGEPVPAFRFEGAEVIQLPPVRAADHRFSGLVDGSGQPLDEAFKRERCRQLLQAFDRVQPDILVIENYPFGRRQLRWELLPLLERAAAAQPRPLIACSVRDIVQVRSDARVQETVQLVQRYFDQVQVHGDPAVVPFEASFSGLAQIQERVRYTGYVTETPAHSGANLLASDEVLVSAGGGAVGFELMQAALKGRVLTSIADLSWRLLLGPNLAPEQSEELIAQAPSGVILESLRPDFPQLLAGCRLSISQGGYNTLMDLLHTRTPAVIVPFEGEGETEQLQRSLWLERAGRCVVLREQALTPERLAAAVEQALQTPVAALSVDLQGARHSAELLWQAWEARHG